MIPMTEKNWGLPTRCMGMLLMALVTGLALAACGGADTPNSSTERAAAESQATESQATESQATESQEGAGKEATPTAGQETIKESGEVMSETGGTGGRDASIGDVDFSSVRAGWRHTCGIQTDGSVACWGYDEYGKATPPQGIFSSVSAGWEHNCGVQTDGTVACWGSDIVGQTPPPEGEFVSVSAGRNPDYGRACGVQTDGSIACWGNYARGVTAPTGN